MAGTGTGFLKVAGLAGIGKGFEKMAGFAKTGTGPDLKNGRICRNRNRIYKSGRSRDRISGRTLHVITDHSNT